MTNLLFYCAGTTPACRFAAEELKDRHIPFIGHISPEITHLLLDVPGFGADGQLRGGGDLKKLLHMLPSGITVIGGSQTHPALTEYRILDLLQDSDYLAQNAFITAECALQAAAPLMTTTFRGTPVLVAGWGRIGKCLCRLLQALGCQVTVSARKKADRAMIRALGMRAVSMDDPVGGYRLIFNTVPEMIFPQERLAAAGSCLKIDLASRQGMEGEDVIRARGLPGVYAPESSGMLICDTVLRLIKEEEP